MANQCKATIPKKFLRVKSIVGDCTDDATAHFHNDQHNLPNVAQIKNVNNLSE